jgi:3-oxoacyl-[acyl-carrier protein] reductase
VSGATSGFGLRIAQHFVEVGFNVIFCGRNADSLDIVYHDLLKKTSSNQIIKGFQADVTNESDLEAMFAALRTSDIKIDVLICNAGVIGPIDNFLSADLEIWREAFEINLFGTVNLIKFVLPSMVAAKCGKIIHISGGGATAPLPSMSGYAASKAAAVRFIETIALEYRNDGVQINSVAPGMLKTKMLEQMLEAGPERIGTGLFDKSRRKKGEISDSIPKAIELLDFLVSEGSFGITGKLISAEWDSWKDWPQHLDELNSSDVYTLRRIVGRDREKSWGDI